MPEKARQIMPQIPRNYPQSYQDAERIYRSGKRTLSHETHLTSILLQGEHLGRDKALAVTLLGTHVVTFYPDGKVILDTGGWNTPTTRRRFKACGFNVTAQDVRDHGPRWTVREPDRA